MKKITLSIALLTTMLATKAQDTTCTMVKRNEVVEFNYRTSEIIEREDYKGIVFIEVGYREVLCLHLFDNKLRVRKVIITYPNGEQTFEVVDSKDNVYYSPIGPVTIEVKRPKFMILR
tara:strand:- start:152 stop:505 length:354 start_codon:yes stop_codon:yes gene_type:complete